MRAFVAALAVIALAPVTLRAQSPVAIDQEPHHRLVWHTGTLRVLDVQIPPGDTTLFHVHDAAIMYVRVAASPVETQVLGAAWVQFNPADAAVLQAGAVDLDTVYVTHPLTHRVTNVGTGPFHLVAVLNDGPGDGATSGAGMSPPPGILEHQSGWFQQSRLALPPGAATQWLASPRPIVLVQPGDGSVVVEGAEGGSHGVLDGAGSWAYIPAGGSFRFMNKAAQPASIVCVQVR